MSSFKPRYGASPNPAGGFDFRIWAPKQKRLGIRIGGQDHDLQPGDGGEFTGTIPTAAAGQDYQVVLADGQARPDPASRWQPDGVHGPSRLFDPRFAFSDIAWRGVALGELIFYELHSGTFTREGTFDGIATKLDYFCDLGITAVELMPAIEFPGRRNWGYDGVNLYAPHSAYGGPEGLQRLVDACHAKGLAVFLDVVYNHFGPEGNYLCDFAPYFTSAYQTPWGNAIDFSAPQVRRYFIDNALYWLANFHIDGLRLDALHEIYDGSEPHFLEELSREFTETAKSLGRQAWLIAESERDDIRKRGIHSIWHDEFHHALAPVLTSNRRGYLGRYG